MTQPRTSYLACWPCVSRSNVPESRCHVATQPEPSRYGGQVVGCASVARVALCIDQIVSPPGFGIHPGIGSKLRKWSLTASNCLSPFTELYEGQHVFSPTAESNV